MLVSSRAIRNLPRDDVFSPGSEGPLFARLGQGRGDGDLDMGRDFGGPRPIEGTMARTAT